ncbi:adenosylcobinamide amidohydrolase [Ammonifex thiophilus]|uniref:Adenosylcobinamide amidohydrolase n=1 Tax=Ammonifex thiophilus TaxID=444093 RepID=A0A3D8P345_9THEO|nr:adenosylcobinamide amidohydrolase [Ammonifex thiophilus]RDV80729.1 hypothetical protein DXX99_10555 [Ammonifex thiophilus]
MHLGRGGSGEEIFLHGDSLIVLFPAPRRVVSTARLNGGYREDIKAVFNHHVPPCSHGHDPKTLPGRSWEGYLAYTAQELGLSPKHSVGLLTAARMENASCKSERYRNLEVTAIVTAGVDVNGGRAGDPARYYEEEGKWIFVGGTINIILLINGNLPPHTLVRSVVTATEAKAAALQELMVPSRYSRGLATGSGTDQIVAVADQESPYRFSDAGKHSKLGELIGAVVKEAVKEALEKETGLNAQRQKNFLVRLQRYNLGPEEFWQQAEKEGGNLAREAYLSRLNQLAREEKMVALTAALLHLLDEQEWGLLSQEAVKEIGCRLISSYLPVEAPQKTVKNPADDLLRLLVRGVNRLISSWGQLPSGRALS